MFGRWTPPSAVKNIYDWLNSEDAKSKKEYYTAKEVLAWIAQKSQEFNDTHLLCPKGEPILVGVRAFFHRFSWQQKWAKALHYGVFLGWFVGSVVAFAYSALLLPFALLGFLLACGVWIGFSCKALDYPKWLGMSSIHASALNHWMTTALMWMKKIGFPYPHPIHIDHYTVFDLYHVWQWYEKVKSHFAPNQSKVDMLTQMALVVHRKNPDDLAPLMQFFAADCSPEELTLVRRRLLLAWSSFNQWDFVQERLDWLMNGATLDVTGAHRLMRLSIQDRQHALTARLLKALPRSSWPTLAQLTQVEPRDGVWPVEDHMPAIHEWGRYAQSHQFVAGQQCAMHWGWMGTVEAPGVPLSSSWDNGALMTSPSPSNTSNVRTPPLSLTQ